jgi:hypothetical protein
MKGKYVRRLLTLLFVLVLGVGIAIPAHAQSVLPFVPMPNLVDDGFVQTGSNETYCGLVDIDIRAYNLIGNEKSSSYDAVAFYVSGQDQPYLIAMYHDIPGVDTDVDWYVVLYTSKGEVLYSTYQIMNARGSGDICSFLPQP